VTSRSAATPTSSPFEILLVATRLGLVSFGGPIAHLGYFRREYVERRHWIDDQAYADLVALFQSVPGPTSSEVGIAIGLLRGGPLGAFVAWLGFTAPSALLMFAFGTARLQPAELGWVFTLLKLVAFAVVTLAVWRMAHALAWDAPRGAIAVVSAALALLIPSTVGQIAVIAGAGVIGAVFVAAPASEPRAAVRVPVPRGLAVIAFVLYLGLLLGLPVARAVTGSADVALFDSFYRASALVFGGGHVLLPLLEPEVVRPGLVSLDQFVAGYGAVQLVPGPINTFASYLGVLIGGVRGALIAISAVFLPAFLLVFAALPLWGALRERPLARRALRGVNAAVVGLLLAALVTIARSLAGAVLPV
jgi:chromate transporter